MTIPDALIKKICDGAAERMFEHLNAAKHFGRESPIEEVFSTAVFAYWGHFCDGVLQTKRRLETLDEFIAEVKARSAKECFAAIMASQIVVGKYRVDFLFGTKLENREALALYAVECDGHQFHEKTKEQAIRDKSRDRALLALGIKTVRFTGAEIWSDPMRCVDELMALITKETEDAHREHFKLEAA